MEPGAPLVHEGSPIFASASGPIQPHGNILNHATWSAGDLAQGFRESDLIFEHTFTTTWVHQGYMEPYACVVAIDAAGRMQVWANNKVPYTLRKQLADALGFSEDQIVVNPCGIGGDFGGKSPAMNVPLAYFLSLRSGRPVKMIMSYTEELMAGNPRHPAVVTIKTGVKSDGTFWARHSTVVYNGGAYSGFRGRPGLAGSRDAAGGQYHIPHVQVDSYMVYTNNVPCGSYRAPGQPQVVFAVESHTDMIAHAMGIDPYALRLRNVLQDGQVCATGGRYKHIRGEATLRPAVEAANWGAPTSGPYVGRGISRGQRPQGQSVYAVTASGAPISFARTTEAKEPDVTCFSAQVAEVEVDPETGAIKVRKFVTAHDVGTIHNPMTHQGQIDGAIMQGVGYALMEQLASEEGHISTLSMGEVKTPTMQDMPALVTVLVESPGGNGPYGAKTIGEQPLPPVAPAIANAVYDAVGVRIQDLPITAEKVLAALQQR